tara:strand:+ start:765 stop:923 length:159 start_codon:yes stop_codon:yes gene_type:complete
MIKYYWESLFNENLTFILGFEAVVFMFLLFFVSIVIRLHRMEKKIDDINEYF